MEEGSEVVELTEEDCEGEVLEEDEEADEAEEADEEAEAPVVKGAWTEDEDDAAALDEALGFRPPISLE